MLVRKVWKKAAQKVVQRAALKVMLQDWLKVLRQRLVKWPELCCNWAILWKKFGL